MYFEIINCSNCYYQKNSEICIKCVDNSEWTHAWGIKYIEKILNSEDNE